MYKNSIRMIITIALALVTANTAWAEPFRIFSDNPGYSTWPAILHVDKNDNLYAGESMSFEVIKYDPTGKIVLRLPLSHSITGLTTDAEGKIYAIDYSILYKFNPDGTPCRAFKNNTTHMLPGFAFTRGIYPASQGGFYVAFLNVKQVRRYKADGTPDNTYADKGKLQLDFAPAYFYRANGKFYFVDQTANQLKVTDEAGNPIGSYTPPDGSRLYQTLYVTKNRVYLATMAVGKYNVVVLDPKLKKINESKMSCFPRSIAEDSKGNIYFGSDWKGLMAFNPDFTARNEFNGKNLIGGGARDDGNLAVAGGLALDAGGNIIVSDYSTGRIQVLSATDGSFIRKLALRQTYNAAIVCDSSNNIFVGNCVQGYVSKIGPDGKILWRKGSRGSKVGQFLQIWEMALDKNGNLLVCEGVGARIQALNGDLEPAALFGTESTLAIKWLGKHKTYCLGVAVDAEGNIYASQNAGVVAKYRPDGTEAKDFDAPGGKGKINYFGKRTRTKIVPGGFGTPGAIAISPKGDIYVADVLQNCIHKFDMRGRFKGRFGSTGYGPGQFRHPSALTLDRKGHLYVSDRFNSRIYKLKLDEAFPG